MADAAPPTFVPKKAGSKKKKKKKKTSVSNKEPELDPHYEGNAPSTATQTQQKPKTSHKKRTHFEMDDAAPTISLSSGFNRYSKYGRAARGGDNQSQTRITGDSTARHIAQGVKNRIPKGTRTKMESAAVTNEWDADDNDNLDKLERVNRQFTQEMAAPTVLEDDDDSHDDDASRQLKNRADEDAEEHKNVAAGGDNDGDGDDDDDDDECMQDPWHDEVDNKYTPISLSTKPSYGGLRAADMPQVLTEKADGNEFVFMQLPSVLPLQSRLSESDKADLRMQKKVRTSLLRQFGEGEIGKLRVRKSGKTELVIGDFVMDVDFAAPMDCYQQVMHLRLEMITDDHTRQHGYKGKCQFLGHVPPQNNLVCSYRAKDLTE
eukprot:CAMPEP_0202690344 /NCGR_PEP_ID=MMETSP1385-20130828/5354_1 /ASSEMBLY_ACC=CAM_ASM_000861 /TAXON_ID=933848 /ORGANISM="Elphidium margaritaceum" /LENGTH=375 /DNA_ID=CAMNT_0049345593 /DNA_START=26 /DNA_END=1150 /DNA_ORIENTATION=-